MLGNPFLQVIIYDIHAMSMERDFYWRLDGFTWTGGYSKLLPDSKKNWKVFYYKMVDKLRNEVGIERREYIRVKIAGNITELLNSGAQRRSILAFYFLPQKTSLILIIRMNGIGLT